MDKDSMFDNEVWKSLLFILRDRELRPLNNKKTIAVKEGGRVTQMNSSDLEEKLLSDLPDLLISQTCIPEHLVNDDSELLNSAELSQKLKNVFESEVQKKLLENEKYSRMTEVQAKLAKDSAIKQTLTEIKMTWEATDLQKRQADAAEAIVQREVFRAARKHGIILTVLTGISTYKQVAQHLSDLGIQCAKFGDFVKLREGSTCECEHDVAVVGILPTGLFLTFIQVNTV